MKCLFCNLRNKEKSLRCRYCKHNLYNANDGIEYVKNGFSRVFRECDTLEKKVNELTGAVFKRHAYTGDELLESEHFNKIESFSGKIKDDIERWGTVKKLSVRIYSLYNENVREVHERLDRIIQKITNRKPTGWEKLCEVFRAFFRFIKEKVLPVISFNLLPGPVKKQIPKGA
jgi:hypothetical protein